jgi:hypothetical protein
MAGILTKGITLSYKTAEGADFIELTNLQEIPEIGNGEKEMIDVTVLSDDVKKSIAGLGDSAQTLAFKFLYEKAQFETLIGLDASMKWKVSMPDGVNATFDGTPAVKFDSAAPNNALTYTLSIGVESKIEFATAA